MGIFILALQQSDELVSDIRLVLTESIPMYTETTVSPFTIVSPWSGAPCDSVPAPGLARAY